MIHALQSPLGLHLNNKANISSQWRIVTSANTWPFSGRNPYQKVMDPSQPLRALCASTCANNNYILEIIASSSGSRQPSNRAFTVSCNIASKVCAPRGATNQPTTKATKLALCDKIHSIEILTNRTNRCGFSKPQNDKENQQRKPVYNFFNNICALRGAASKANLPCVASFTPLNY